MSFTTVENKPLNRLVFYLDVRFLGLKELPESDSIKLVGQTNIHPINHYGTDALLKAIQDIAKAYVKAHGEGIFNDQNGVAPKGDLNKLHVNDMSLRYGGRLDIGTSDYGKAVSTPFEPSHLARIIHKIGFLCICPK